jgi:hypothetical protein
MESIHDYENRETLSIICPMETGEHFHKDFPLPAEFGSVDLKSVEKFIQTCIGIADVALIISL